MVRPPAGKKPAQKKATPAKKPVAAKKAAGKTVRAPRKTPPPPAKAPAGPGRPTDFRPEYVEQARKIAALGATEVEMADFFGVTTVTLFNWRTQHPEFFNATRLGKEEADDRVEQRLFARAMGYEHDEVDIRVVNGEIVKTPIRKFYPPDTAAASLWLRNRRPGAWRDKVEAIHTGADGGPIQSRIAVEFVKPAPRAEDD